MQVPRPSAPVPRFQTQPPFVDSVLLADLAPDAGIAPEKTHTFASLQSVKAAAVAFVIYLLVASDVFVESVVDRLAPGSLSGRVVTNKGTAVQGVLFVLLCAAIFVLGDLGAI